MTAQRPRQSRKRWAGLLLLLAACIYLFPLYLLLVNAFKDYEGFMRSPYGFPNPVDFSSLATAYTRGNFPEAMGNTLVTTLIVVSLLVCLSSMAAYGLVRRKGKALGVLYIYFMGGILVPFQVYMITLVQQFQLFGIGRSLWALVLTFTAANTPLSVFLYSGYLKTIPLEVEEAALIDGCSPMRLFWRIVFPLLAPCTSTVVILNSVSVWNSYTQPLVIVGATRWKMLFVQVYTLLGGSYYQRWNVAFAACFLASLPMLVIYIIMQRQITAGLTSGAVKG